MRTLRRVCIFLFIAVLMVLVFSKLAFLPQILPKTFALASAVLMLALGALLVRYGNIIEGAISAWNPRVPYRVTLVLLTAFFIGLRLATIFVLRIDAIHSHPDMIAYVTSAQEIAYQGFVQQYATYCYTFTHIFWFGVFLSPVFLFGASVTSFSIYLMVFSALTMIMIVDTVKYCTSHSKALIVGLVLCILPAQVLSCQYVTHETAALFFASFTLWIYFRVVPSLKNSIGRFGPVFLAAFSALCASLLNASGLVLIIAIILVAVLNSRITSRDGLKSGVMTTLLFVTILVVGTVAARDYQIHHSVLKEDIIDEDKIVWTLFVGSNAETGGQWSAADVDAYQDYPIDATKEEIHDYRIGLLSSRYQSLLHSPSLALHLILEKLTNTWSCFYYPILYANETITADGVISLYNAIIDRLLVLIEYGISFVLLCYVCAGWVRRIRGNSYADEPFAFFLSLYLMGIVFLFLLSECNNKYTLSIQPFIICLVALAFPISAHQEA